MTLQGVTRGEVQMLGHRALRFFLAAVLCATVSPIGVVMAHDEEIVIARELELRKTEHIIDTDKICPEMNDQYRLAVSSIAAGDAYFQFDNLSGVPIFVYLMRDGESFRTDYPIVEVLFKSAEGDAWSVPMMNPGTFIQDGLERVPVGPGTSIVFKAPVSAYLSPSAKTVMLQLRFHTSPHGKASNACVSSAPFTLPTSGHESDREADAAGTELEGSHPVADDQDPCPGHGPQVHDIDPK